MIEIDQKSLSELEQKLLKLTTKQQKQACKAALRRGANIILRESRKNLKTKVKRKQDGYKDMVKGMQVYVKKDGNSATISVFGQRKYAKSYLLRFYEKGTGERYWKRRYARGKNGGRANFGSVKPLCFFGDARNAKGDQATRVVEEQMMVNIDRIWNKNGK